MSDTFRDRPTILETLSRRNRANLVHFPGESGARQPVHTVYGGAHLFRSTTAERLGSLALKSLDAWGDDSSSLSRIVGMSGPDGQPADGDFAESIDRRMRSKLEREAVEDFRIDFEDGYGHRSDEEEDGHAQSAAAEAAKGLKDGTLPPFLGIRIKTLSDELARRSLRTLDLFVTRFVETAGRLPETFVVTLPKIQHEGQVEALGWALEGLETKLGLDSGSIPIELMVETPQTILDAEGRWALPALVRAANGRCRGAHFGTYDYTALLQITAAHQHMAHPVCDFAKHAMQVALAGTGVWLSDGATNVLPVTPHRAAEGEELSTDEKQANREAGHDAWRLHFGHVRHSLVGGFYQGWDLHPAQLPTRYAAVFSFFLEGLEAAGDRLKNFVEQAARATLVGDVFDDAATGQGLLNYFLRAINCGAITPEDAERRLGLSVDELELRSFSKILEGRKGS